MKFLNMSCINYFQKIVCSLYKILATMANNDLDLLGNLVIVKISFAYINQ